MNEDRLEPSSLLCMASGKHCKPQDALAGKLGDLPLVLQIPMLTRQATSMASSDSDTGRIG